LVSDGPVVIDAGPLVAYFVAREALHSWAKAMADGLPTPFLTSEAVLTETCYLLQRYKLSLAPVFELLREGVIVIAFDLGAEHRSLDTLIARYANLPMSLADATLVRLAELHDTASVFTLDGHFRIYRKHGRRQIPLIIPDAVG
jgi:uncharacterized protein